MFAFDEMVFTNNHRYLKVTGTPDHFYQSHYTELTMDNGIHYWDEGPLTYADLSSRKSEWPKISEFQYNISWGTRDWKTGNTRFIIPLTRSYLNPFSSWVHPDYRTKEMLQYIQTGFDYVEICRRRAMNEIMQGTSFEWRSVMNFHLAVADSFLAKMKEDTEQGQDVAVVQDYARRVTAELAKTEEPLFNDMRIYPHGFGLGMHCGIGSEFYVGPMAHYVTPIAGIDFGCDFCFSRINFYCNGLLGWGGRYKQPILRDGYQWNAGERISGGNLEASFGYTVLDSQWWKIDPFAGFGVGFIDYPFHPTNQDKNKDEISGLRYQAGLSADLKYRRVVESSQALEGLTEFCLRTRLYVAHSSFPSPTPSWTINLGLSVNTLAWILKK